MALKKRMRGHTFIKKQLFDYETNAYLKNKIDFFRKSCGDLCCLVKANVFLEHICFPMKTTLCLKQTVAFL